MGKRKKKKKKWKNKHTSNVYFNNSYTATSEEINKIAFEVFGSLYYKSNIEL